MAGSDGPPVPSIRQRRTPIGPAIDTGSSAPAGRDGRPSHRHQPVVSQTARHSSVLRSSVRRHVWRLSRFARHTSGGRRSAVPTSLRRAAAVGAGPYRLPGRRWCRQQLADTVAVCHSLGDRRRRADGTHATHQLRHTRRLSPEAFPTSWPSSHAAIMAVTGRAAPARLGESRTARLMAPTTRSAARMAIEPRGNCPTKAAGTPPPRRLADSSVPVNHASRPLSVTDLIIACVFAPGTSMACQPLLVGISQTRDRPVRPSIRPLLAACSAGLSRAPGPVYGPLSRLDTLVRRLLIRPCRPCGSVP